MNNIARFRLAPCRARLKFGRAQSRRIDRTLSTSPQIWPKPGKSWTKSGHWALFRRIPTRDDPICGNAMSRTSSKAAELRESCLSCVRSTDSHKQSMHASPPSPRQNVELDAGGNMGVGRVCGAAVGRPSPTRSLSNRRFARTDGALKARSWTMLRSSAPTLAVNADLGVPAPLRRLGEVPPKQGAGKMGCVVQIRVLIAHVRTNLAANANFGRTMPKHRHHFYHELPPADTPNIDMRPDELRKPRSGAMTG